MSQRRREPEARMAALEARLAALEAAVNPTGRTCPPELEAYYAQTRRPDIHRRSTSSTTAVPQE